MKVINYLIVLVMALILTACGTEQESSNTSVRPVYTGIENAAIVSSSSANVFAGTVVEATESQMDVDRVPRTAFNANQGSSTNRVLQFLNTVARQDGNTLQTQSMHCGGSMDVSQGSIQFDNLCIPDGSGGTILIDGVVEFELSMNSITYRWIDLQITYKGETKTYNLRFTVEDGNVNVVYQGPDGKMYQISNFAITGNYISGYSINGRVYDPDYGYVDVLTNSPILYDHVQCASGRPVSGSISIEGASVGVAPSEATITFLDCERYSISENGNAEEVYNW